MATKKQKREQVLAKRAAFEAELKAEGLKALAADRERRKVEEARALEDAHKVHLKRNRFHDKCELCAKVKAQQAIDKLAKATAKARENYTLGPDGKHPGITGNLLTEDEAQRMDQESSDRVKDILQEMGALTHKGDNTPIDLTRVEKASA